MDGDWGYTASRFIYDIDPCYVKIFYFSILTVMPQKPVQMNLFLLQPNRVVNFLDVTKGSKDACLEPQEDSFDQI